MTVWADESVFYQLYPLGFSGAPYVNNGEEGHGLARFAQWIPHLNKLGVNAIYFGPIFSSDTHGYNTRDYKKIDNRIGTNDEFKVLVKELHDAGIRVILDGVFNHVGRGFFGFLDVKEKKWDSPYKDWFYLNFDGNSDFNDEFWYEGWEGNYDLVKLNLSNPQVVDYLLDAVNMWIEEFDIDGLRLDVAYMLDRAFMGRLSDFCRSKKDDFFLLGEMIHGNYRDIVRDGLLDSATNYECYKGLHSSFNSMNLFEINHSLLRQYGPEDWTLYRGMHLMNFLDNHDVGRIASVMNDNRQLIPAYAIMIGMPGIPCIYYGSEWGIEGRKEDGDPTLRPYIEKPEWNTLTEAISKMTQAKKESKALQYGGFRSVLLTNRQCIFERAVEDERVLVAINAEEAPFMAHFDAGCGTAVDMLTGEKIDFGGGTTLPGFYAAYWKMER